MNNKPAVNPPIDSPSFYDSPLCLEITIGLFAFGLVLMWLIVQL